MIEQREFEVALQRANDLVNRLINVDAVADRDRVSGEALTQLAMSIGMECACSDDGWSISTAAELGQGVFGTRVMRRAIRVLANAGLMECENFRLAGSPRVRRRILWSRYLEFVDSILSREDCARERLVRVTREERFRLAGRQIQHAQASDAVQMPCTAEGLDCIAC